MTGRDSHSILLQICGQQITATDMSQDCDSEFLATDLRAELALCRQWGSQYTKFCETPKTCKTSLAFVNG